MKKRQNRVQFVRPEEPMDSIERWGNDVETAVKLALEELGATEEEVDVEVMEEPTKGFFGIGAKLARVKVTKKNLSKEKDKGEEKPAKKNRGPIRKEEVTEEELNFDNGGRGPRDSGGRSERNGRSGGRKSGSGRNRNYGGEESKNYDELLPEEPVMPVVDRSTLQDMPEGPGLEFLKNVISEMGIDVTVTGMTDGKDQYYFLEGKDSGTIIGKRGATLDAIQYLTSLVVNKGGSQYVRVVCDAENYRAKREKALEKLAMRLADKVARSGRSYKLEPMNPYERKVIHSTLQKDSRIVTRSEGQDPARRVIIDVKK